MKEIFARHEKAALQFSGGKDSLACLWLIEPWWNKTTIVWVNTGAYFPHSVRQVERVKALVPHFLEVKTDQAKDIEENGYPVDVLPVVNHSTARIIGEKKPKMQTFLECCWKNIMWPAFQGVKETGATLLIRGQKAADHMKGQLSTGMVREGIELFYPLEGWNDEDVMEFLAGTPLGIPEHYRYVNSSLDCWSCTAYLQNNIGKMTYMRERFPLMHKEVQIRLQEIESAIHVNDYTGRAISA